MGMEQPLYSAGRMLDRSSRSPSPLVHSPRFTILPCSLCFRAMTMQGIRQGVERGNKG